MIIRGGSELLILAFLKIKISIFSTIIKPLNYLEIPSGLLGIAGLMLRGAGTGNGDTE